VCTIVRSLVADFYELPRGGVDELRAAASRRWLGIGRSSERWRSTLGTLRRPVDRHESQHYYFAAVLGVVGDAPLRDGSEMLGGPAGHYQDLLTELVESRGGGWDIIEPSPDRLAALDPATFDAQRLRAHYAGQVDYYPDDDPDDESGLIGTLLDRLIPDAAERVPADAGEQMLQGIALLHTALSKIRGDSVLLVHTY
jgi:hypothetical protein